MKGLNTIWKAIIVVLFAMSCEEKVSTTITAEDTNLLVVEGVITNEKINHRIKLTHPHFIQNENTQPATGATVAIIDSDENIFPLTEIPSGSGEYYTDSLRAVFGKVYLLYINYLNKEYFAFDHSPAGQPLQPIVYLETGLTNTPMYSLVFSESGTSSNYITYDINWENTAGCISGDNCSGRLVYYDLKNIDVQEIYAPEKEGFSFPEGSSIIRKKYSVSDGYKEFLRALLSETEWRGGFFDIERANLPTNLSDGAVGYFAVSTVVSDTTVVGQ